MTMCLRFVCGVRSMPASLLALAGLAIAQPKPNEPAHGWIPTPSFTSPASHQKFEPGPSLTVNVKAEIPPLNPGGYSVPGPFDFVAYAKASPYAEKWHVHIVKQGPGGSEVLLQKFEGPVTGKSISIVLDSLWFAKHGQGKYAAFGFLSQTTSKGMDHGMTSAVGFQINVPRVSAKQPVSTLGPLVAKPFGAAAANDSSVRPGARGAVEARAASAPRLR